MFVLKEAQVKTEAIPSHITKYKTLRKGNRDKGEKNTAVSNARKINKVTTLCIPTEK